MSAVAAPIASLAANAHFMDEKDVKACLECGNAFNSITRRKHHCRVCGRIVCWFCSMHTMHDPLHPAAAKVRACNSCYAAAHATPATTLSAAATATRALSHSRSTSLSLPHSPAADDPTSGLSHSQADRTPTSLLSTSPGAVDELTGVGGVVVSPLKDSLQPLPMPVFSSPDAVDNTVAAVTTILLEEERKREHSSEPVHVTAHTVLPASPAHKAVISDAMPHTTAESPSDNGVGKLSIIVPAKSPRHRSNNSDPSTPSVFKPDVSPVSASEPVSPSHALEQHLKHQPISPLPAFEPATPNPHPPSPAPDHHHHHLFHPHHSLSSTAAATTSVTSTTPNSSTATTTTTVTTASTAPPSPRPETDDKVVLDLPMKLCLTGDHRVLTRQGWKSIKKVDEKDEALSFNIESYEMEWKPVVEVTSRALVPTSEADTLFRMQGDYMDVIATRDHRMLLACVTTCTDDGLAQTKQLEYKQVGDLVISGLTGRPTYTVPEKSTVTAFAHSSSHNVVCAGINKQAPIKIVIPGLERVCDWWWERDEQAGFLGFLGFWLGDGHLLDTMHGHVMIGQRKNASKKWLTALFDQVFPGCWYSNAQPDPLMVVYKVLCPPLYDYLRLMAVGPVGYNPRDPDQLRAYPHFIRNEELAVEEQKSGYYTAGNSLGYDSRWEEDKMLAKLALASQPAGSPRGVEEEEEEEVELSAGVEVDGTQMEAKEGGVVDDEEVAANILRCEAVEVDDEKDEVEEVGRRLRVAGKVCWFYRPRASLGVPSDSSTAATSPPAASSPSLSSSAPAAPPVPPANPVPLPSPVLWRPGLPPQVPNPNNVVLPPGHALVPWNHGWWIIINEHWFYLKRWLGNQQMVASTWSRLSRVQAVALLDGFCRADGRWKSVEYGCCDANECRCGLAEPTGSWVCSNSSFPLIDQLQMISQLAGCRLTMSLHTKAGQSTEYKGRLITLSVDHWLLTFGFTNAKRSFHTAPLARPDDVSDNLNNARGYYDYKDDGKVYCITVEGNTNFLTERLAQKRNDVGGVTVTAHAQFVGNCLVILKRTAADMKSRYSEYLRTKEARHEAQPLTFQQFMFFSTIRTLPDFLFKKTDLAYCMMRDEGASVVGREMFVRYAPILPPLASKLDAERVFEALAVDFGDVRGVGLNVFKAYVDNLQKEWALDKQWETWRDDYELPKSETLLSVRNGVTDTTHFPPHMGTVGLTSSHLLYQSVFKKRRCISWLDIVKIERNSDGIFRKNDNAGIKLHYLREAAHDHKEAEAKEEMKLEVEHVEDTTHLTVRGTTNAAHRFGGSKHRSKSSADKSPIKVLHWDLPGMSSEAHHLKVSFYLQLRILHMSHQIAHHLHDTDPLIAAATLQETFDLVRRMRALEHVPTLSGDASKLNPYGHFDDSGRDDFIRRIREVVRKTERVKDSKKNWLTSFLPGLAGEKDGVKGAKGSEGGPDDIDPEFKPAYKTLAEMNKEIEEEEPFSVKAFSYNVKLFSRQLQPLIFFIGLVNRVRNWENPLVTASIVAVLLNMCYRNYLVYLPAMIILVNIVILVIFRFDPDFIQNYLDEEKKRDEEQEALEDSSTNSAPVIISTITTSSSASHTAATSSTSSAASAADAVTAAQPIASAVTVVRPSKPDPAKKKDEPSGLLAKLKEYRDVAVKTKDHLESVQHALHDINVRTLRVEGLYKWVRVSTTSKFLALMCVVFVLLCVVPFRFLFPFVLVDWVTNKWQKEGSALDRLLAEVPLPEKMPELD